MRNSSGLFSFEDWWLTPEGAIAHRDARTAVIADVHLGYEWARGKSGDSIPAHSLPETIARIECLLRRFPKGISTLIVAGDLVESRRPCRRTVNDVRRFRLWLDERGIELIPLAGNHDPRTLLEEYGRQPTPTVWEIAGWTIGHGDQPIPSERIISGHIHPIFRFEGLTAPCFLIGERRVVLPAFSRNAAGLDVLSRARLPEFPEASPRCLVSTGDEVLDFGTLESLRPKTRTARPFVEGGSR